MAELGPHDVSVTVEKAGDGGGVVIRLAGELDLATSATVAQAVETVLATGPARAVFDLSALTFMDSSGIALLLSVAQRVPVVVRSPSPIVRQVITMTGLAQALPMVE
jgi:anti-anti-sigma factor